MEDRPGNSEPPLVYETFRPRTGDTAMRIVGAIAAEKPFAGAMATNVASIIDEQIMEEFDKLRDQMVRDNPRLKNRGEFASGFALRRYAYLGTAEVK